MICKLGIITALVFGAICANAIPLSSPCTEEEMLSPMNIIHKDIEEMQAEDVNTDLMMKQIENMLENLQAHMDEVKKTCGEEKVGPMERMSKFMSKIQMMNDIMAAMDSGDMDKAKNMMETLNCEHMVQYIVRKYSVSMDKIEKLMELIKTMDDMKMINQMNEAMIYIMDDDNMIMTKKMIPMMKDQIMENKDKMNEETLMAAKLNMKEMVKRMLPKCNEGLMAMHEVDKEMAHQAMYEATFQLFSDTIYSRAYKMVMDAPDAHMKRIGMEAMYDKLKAMERENSLSASKLMVMAEKMMECEEMKNDAKAMELMNNIINSATLFAKNAAEGYSCQHYERIKANMENEDINEMEHNEYYLFYNPGKPDMLQGKFKEDPNGDMMMVTVDKEYNGTNVQYMIIMKKGDYPDNIHMKGNIVSKKMLMKEETNKEELCAMNPKPHSNICVPLRELFTYTMNDAAENRHMMFEKFMEHIKACHEDQNLK